jgi:hypothetical protein
MEIQSATRRTEARTQVTQADETMFVGGNVEVLQQEQGENLMFRRVLINPETKAAEGPEQRNTVFKTKCKPYITLAFMFIHLKRALSIFLATNHILCWQMGVKPYIIWVVTHRKSRHIFEVGYDIYYMGFNP